MHRRKRFLVYPPGYAPLGSRRYVVCASLRQAKITARRMGAGAEIDEAICVHLRKHTQWVSSTHGRTWA